MIIENVLLNMKFEFNKDNNSISNTLIYNQGVKILTKDEIKDLMKKKDFENVSKNEKDKIIKKKKEII